MRAWQVQGRGEPEEVLHLVEAEPPEAGVGQVRVRVAAAALGLPDVFMCRGYYPLTPPLPFTPGQEVAGTVTAVGPGVEGGAVGSRVLGVTLFTDGRGGFADETLLRAEGTYPVGEAMSDEDAAGFFIPFHTGWIGLHQRGNLQPGEQLVVLGAAGGCGSAAIQLGRAQGARVIAVAGGAEKVAYCAALGADVVIDHTETDIAAAIREATGGRGADVVYDPVGGAQAQAASAAMANEGRFLLVGFASGEWFGADAHRMVVGNYSVMGVYAGAYDRQFNQAAHGRLLDLVDRGMLEAEVRTTAPFEELPAALARLAERAALGKSVLMVASR